MSSILDFLGGAAATGQGILANQMQADTQLAHQKTMAEFAAELAVQKQQTIDELRDDRHRRNAKAVTDAADKTRSDRILGKLNAGPVDPLGTDATQGYLQSDPAQDAGPYSGMQVTGGDASGLVPPNMASQVNVGGPAAAALATDAATPRKSYSLADLAGLTPEQLQRIGVNDSRSQRMDDLAGAAESLGHLDLAKDYRGQQQVEMQRLQAEAAARRNEVAQALAQEREDRRADRDQAWREVQDRRSDIAQQRADATTSHLASLAGAAAGGGVSTMSPEAIQNAAARYNLDGSLPPLGMGKAAGDVRAQILNEAARQAGASGLTPDEQRIQQVGNAANKAALSKLQQQQTMVGAFEKNFVKNADIALEFSGKVDRTGVPIVNGWINSGKRAVAGDPDLSAYDQAIKSVVNEYAKIISGSMGNTATAEGEIRRVGELLNSAQTPEQVNAVIGLMKRETANRMAGFDEQRKELIASFRLNKGSSTAPPTQGPPRVNSPEELAALPSGAIFTAPDGSIRRKP